MQVSPSNVEIHRSLMVSNTSDTADTISGLTIWDVP